MFFPGVGVEISPLLLIGIGLAVGVLSGFFGFGGGFLTTPALNLFGFPMPYAIGTDMFQMAGSSVLSTMRHRKLGHVDLRLAIMMVAGTVSGVELGKHLVMYLEGLGNVDEAIRWVYILVLGGLGLYMINEARKAVAKEKASLHGSKTPTEEVQTGLGSKIRALNLPPLISFPVSGIKRMSVWIPLGVGFITGVMAGLLGVGGGFIRLPTLVYLMGVPTVVAIGTDLFEVIISGSYGAFTYALSNRVELMAAVLILVGSSVGVQLGASATRYVQANRIRLFFAMTILLAGVSVLLKQIGMILGITLFDTASAYLLLSVAGGMSLFIVILFIFARNSALKIQKRLAEQQKREWAVQP